MTAVTLIGPNSLKFNSGYYQRVRGVLVAMTTPKPRPEASPQAVINATGKPPDEWELHPGCGRRA